jgi:hypothetical protein
MGIVFVGADDIPLRRLHHCATLRDVVSQPRITINLEPNERKRLIALAAANDRSIAAEARIAIRAYLDEQVARSTRGKR